MHVQREQIMNSMNYSSPYLKCSTGVWQRELLRYLWKAGYLWSLPLPRSRRKLLENLDHTIPLLSKHTLLLVILLVCTTGLSHMLCLRLGSLLVLCMAPHIPSSACHLLREGMSGHASVKWHDPLTLLFLSLLIVHPFPETSCHTWWRLHRGSVFCQSSSTFKL